MSEIRVEQLPGRTVVSTGRKWEKVVGYSRAVRMGNQIAVTGTIGMRPNGSIPETAAEQLQAALETVIASIEALGGSVNDVIRTRMFVVNIDEWERIGAVHAQFFGEVRPATSMIEISRLADPMALVEVEADAVIL